MDGHDRIQFERDDAAWAKRRPARGRPANLDCVAFLPDIAQSPAVPRSRDAVVHLQQAAGNAGVAHLLARPRSATADRPVQRAPADEAEEATPASPGLLSMRGPEGAATGGATAPGGGLLSSERIRLDPAIGAQISTISTRLGRDSIRRALLDVPLSLSEPLPFLPAKKGALGSMEGTAEPGPKASESRPGTLSDVFDAVGAYPQVELVLAALRARAMERLRRDWRALGTGGKVAVLTSFALISLPATAAAMADKSTRDYLLGQLNDRTFSVPGIDGLTVTVRTQGQDLGVTAMFDLAPYINW
jgi:hypothetical protein